MAKREMPNAENLAMKTLEMSGQSVRTDEDSVIGNTNAMVQQIVALSLKGDGSRSWTPQKISGTKQFLVALSQYGLTSAGQSFCCARFHKLPRGLHALKWSRLFPPNAAELCVKYSVGGKGLPKQKL